MTLQGVLHVLYFVVVFLVVTGFLIVISKGNRSTKFLILLLFSFTGAILSFMLYLGKNNYYFNIIYKYFGISKNLWNLFIFSSFDLLTITRMLNAASLLFIYSSLCFPLTFAFTSGRPGRKILALLALPQLLQLMLFDPVLYENAYKFFYPDFAGIEFIKSYNQILYLAAHSVNMAYMLTGITVLVYSYIKAPAIRLVKSYTVFILILHLTIVFSYLYVLAWSPSLLIKVSKIADYVYYKSVPLGNNIVLYNMFPYFMLASFTAIALMVYRYTVLQRKIHNENLGITREIDAATVTSRVFSHYIKNELFAIMAQIEEAQSRDTKIYDQVLKDISERCGKILSHLDNVHRNIRYSKLTLIPLPLDVIVNETLAGLTDMLAKVKVAVSSPTPCPTALIDKNYFPQVLINLIVNAVDAMKEKSEDSRNLDISITTHNQWIILSIRDNGTGIDAENIKKIFAPFYSTKPASKNWGIGLSLCHKIVLAHDGRISVESEPGKGTAFKILLPRIPAGRAFFNKVSGEG